LLNFSSKLNHNPFSRRTVISSDEKRLLGTYDGLGGASNNDVEDGMVVWRVDKGLEEVVSEVEDEKTSESH